MISNAIDTMGISGLAPLTDDEAALICHVTRWGSDGYPVEKIGRMWHWIDWRSVKGAPVSYRTKNAATAAFEAWHELALDRWRAMRLARPGVSMILTGDGIKYLD